MHTTRKLATGIVATGVLVAAGGYGIALAQDDGSGQPATPAHGSMMEDDRMRMTDGHMSAMHGEMRQAHGEMMRAPEMRRMHQRLMRDQDMRRMHREHMSQDGMRGMHGPSVPGRDEE